MNTQQVYLNKQNKYTINDFTHLAKANLILSCEAQQTVPHKSASPFRYCFLSNGQFCLFPCLFPRQYHVTVIKEWTYQETDTVKLHQESSTENHAFTGYC